MYPNRKTFYPAIPDPDPILFRPIRGPSLTSYDASLEKRVLESGLISPSLLPPANQGSIRMLSAGPARWDSSSFYQQWVCSPPSTPMASPTGRLRRNSPVLSHGTSSQTPGPLGRVHTDIMGRVTPGTESLARLLDIKGWDSPYRYVHARARANLDRKLKLKMKAIVPEEVKWSRKLPQ